MMQAISPSTMARVLVTLVSLSVFGPACQTGPYPIGKYDGGNGDGGVPCVQNSDCPSGQLCGYAVANACMATGVCIDGGPCNQPGATCPCPIELEGCGCDGQPLSYGGCFPAGYTAAPLASMQACGVVPDAGGADSGARRRSVHEQRGLCVGAGVRVCDRQHVQRDGRVHRRRTVQPAGGDVSLPHADAGMRLRRTPAELRGLLSERIRGGTAREHASVRRSGRWRIRGLGRGGRSVHDQHGLCIGSAVRVCNRQHVQRDGRVH